MSVTIPEILSQLLARSAISAGDVLSTGTVSGVAGFKSEDERVALPEARRRDRGGDRADRRAAQPGRLVAGGPRRRRRRRAFAPGARRGRGRGRREARARPRAAGEHALDALVVRAPDNVLYLTNFWGMKGYDACVFPRDGEPVLICLEASAEDAAADGMDRRTSASCAATTSDDPRPPLARTLELALEAATRLRPRRPRAVARARRRRTGWSASRRPSRRPGSTRGPTRPTRLPVLAHAARR